jgi:hypothetical protein
LLFIWTAPKTKNKFLGFNKIFFFTGINKFFYGYFGKDGFIPFCPCFLLSFKGASKTSLSLIEGIAESTASL